MMLPPNTHMTRIKHAHKRTACVLYMCVCLVIYAYPNHIFGACKMAHNRNIQFDSHTHHFLTGKHIKCAQVKCVCCVCVCVCVCMCACHDVCDDEYIYFMVYIYSVCTPSPWSSTSLYTTAPLWVLDLISPFTSTPPCGYSFPFEVWLCTLAWHLVPTLPSIYGTQFRCM